MLLEAREIGVCYGRIQAVRDMSVSVGEGEVVAVLGANGAGKSSLLKALLGLVPAHAGRASFAGKSILELAPAERIGRGLVLVPEGRRIVVTLSTEENLLMGAWGRRDTAAVRAEIAAVYERFPNLGVRRHMPGSVLSGGEQQMLAIARGVLGRPRLMMLDEPSLGLSPLLVEQMFAHLAELNRSGIALLLVEQNTRKALTLARRACVMELGRLVMEGTPEQLLADERLSAAYLGGAANG